MASPSQAAPAFVRLAAHPLRWRLLTALADGDLRVRELTGLSAAPQNLVSYHLRLLRDGGLVTAVRSSHDGRDTYYRLDLNRCARALAEAGTALHPALLCTPAPPLPPDGPQHPAAPAVLFVCTGNSARSPIAEALLRHHTGGRVTAASAGTRPKTEMHPGAVQVLRERYGIDISARRPRPLDALRRRFDRVITLCDKARETFPDLGDARHAHWSTPDPAAAPDGPAAFHRVAADLDARVRHLLPLLAQTPKPAQMTEENP
ncbi:protein-tyrosine-phosphatase/DNA-binding transcriptional ArsR family regulator [Actinomadura coerulea]|uniref:Protein-tyrosine-phosphatase/DNA-binding transcriptional ArsR family regulator n=1 Tax=Actinomadura coerulea TaxID=46159 RepID=A0A7X0KY05_9ACTN|nr:ArsR family transcriptional regulator [Actinomadura coerulea]MBB6394876.1 protein-tyrosine-phosphatase/DNA-binding transcriptional ArsR family regulator [Actinomadura coerulea]